jgi:hypothetical protein
MKTKSLLQVLLTGVAVLLLQGCASTPTGPAALTGTWTNSLGTVWTMRADGSFDVDLNNDGKRDAWGNATITGDTITVSGGGTKMIPKQCKGTKGVYHFKRTGNTLHFTLVNDTCQKRIDNVTKDWTKK